MGVISRTESTYHGPTVYDIYGNLKSNEVVLNSGCGIGRCVGWQVVLDTDTGISRCPACGWSHRIDRSDMYDIIENEKYDKKLTDLMWSSNKDINIRIIKEKLNS